MSGLNTYHQSMRPTSAMCGYACRQAGVQGYLTNTTVAAATTVEDLVDSVNAAVVSAGAASPAQRQSIIAALREGARLGDLSDSRIQAATTPESLAQLTWASDDPDTSHLGPTLI